MNSDQQKATQYNSSILKRLNLKDKENKFNPEINTIQVNKNNSGSEWGLSGDTATFEESYSKLINFVQSSLDIDRYELTTILYPILVRMYLELVYNKFSKEATFFLSKFGPEQLSYFKDDLQKLAMINNKDFTEVTELDSNFDLNNFVIPISRKTLVLLKSYLKDQQQRLLLHIIETYMKFDVYEDVQRNEMQLIASNLIVKEATSKYNKRKINCDVPKVPEGKQPITTFESNEEDTSDKPNAKRAAKTSKLLETKHFNRDNQPADCVPLPGDKKINKKNKKLEEFTLPTIFSHTINVKKYSLTCATVSKDSSMLSVGFLEKVVQVWSLGSEKLKLLKSLEKLQDVDLNAEDITNLVMDDESGKTVRNLLGHEGSINSMSFSSDGKLLLSCSEDTTIRLWSLLIWNCVFIYNTLVFPEWDIKFSPISCYFVTASTDRTAKLWITKFEKPLRIFKGHFSDVDCIQFHPNSNYVATGSCDRRILLWDCATGNNVRIMMGHTSAIYSLLFSICGRFLVSGGADLNILVWDISCGLLITVLNAHKNKITSLAFSSCGNLLASGSLDCTLKLWNFKQLLEDYHKENSKTDDSYILNTYATKMSPVVALQFTNEKLLLSINLSQA